MAEWIGKLDGWLDGNSKMEVRLLEKIEGWSDGYKKIVGSLVE